MVLAMKILSLALLLPLLFVVPACGGEAGAAGAGAATALAEQAKKFAPLLQQVTGPFQSLLTSFAGITDGATADKAKGAIETAVGALKAPLAAIKEMKPDATLMSQLDAVKKPVMDKLGSLMGNNDIVGKIGPALNSLKDLLK
jgi:hypothetical protein